MDLEVVPNDPELWIPPFQVVRILRCRSNECELQMVSFCSGEACKE